MRVERLALGREFAALFFEENQEFRRLLNRQAGRGVFVGCGGRGGLQLAERAVLRFEHRAAVIEHAALFRERAQRVFDSLHPLVGREIHIGRARRHIEDRHLRRTTAGNVQRLVEERGRELFKSDFHGAGRREIERGGARDDGAIGVDGHRGDGRRGWQRRGEDDRRCAGEERGRERPEEGGAKFHGLHGKRVRLHGIN